MTVTLVSVPDVPIVSTGHYTLASGETDFTAEMLADAVLASQDPTVTAPRLKLGHNDPRFAEAIASGELDGEPAFGTVQNLRLSDDGQTIIGDYVDVPDWLAPMLPSAYPGRSIEGGFNFTAASGNHYRLVITACALLGVTWPGVGSLEDLREVMEQNGEAPAAISADGGELDHGRAESFVVARVNRPGDRAERASSAPHEALAGMDLGNVRMQFCGDLDSGEVPQVPDEQPQADDVGSQMWWWPRSVRVEDDGSLCLIVDDDEGHLIRVPFTVQQGDLIYGQPELVIEQYVPVTADPDGEGSAVVARGPRVLASWPIRAARPSTQTEVHHVLINGVDVDAGPLRERLGLADDADDAAIYAALGVPEPEGETEAETAPEAEPVAASGANVPDGMVLVDAEAFAQVQAGAQAGADVAAQLAEQNRDQIIRAAIDDGKIPVGRREFYERAWAADAEGTRTLLTASAADGGLAPGLIPVQRRETGAAGDGEGTSTDEAAHADYMARHNPQAAAKLRAAAERRSGGVRIRQEV